MQKTTLIIPCAGKSSRFPDVRPKWMLTHQNNKPMVVDSITKISGYSEIVIAILKEHDKKYDAAAGLTKAFSDAGYKITVVILPEPTSSQAETIYKTIKQANITGSILVKDCDSQFSLNINTIPRGNFVCTAALEDFDEINPSSKSYIKSSNTGTIEAIKEKQIISSQFSMGGYGFECAKEFSEAYVNIVTHFLGKEMYVSHVIDSMISNGFVFWNTHVKDCKDWGTIEDWKRDILKQKNYIVDIDGVLMQNSGKYFKPRYSESTPCVQKNVDIINKKYNEGSRIILMTARDSSLREFTENQLKKHGVNYHVLLMDNLHSQRIVINDFSTMNPFPSAVALSIPRNFDELEQLL